MTRAILLILALLCAPALTAPRAAWAEAPVVLDAMAKKTGMGWKIAATVQHPDTGWDHYVDAWEVLDKNGRVLGRRDLSHPHVDEQPFTRSLQSVMIPDGVYTVYIRARCSNGGAVSDLFELPLRR